MTAHKKTTSWGGVAKWYGEHLKGEDTYHAQVIEPQLMRLLNIEKGAHVLDIGCGEGYFTRAIAKAGASVVGSDIAAPLIEQAKKKSPDIEYHVASADDLSFAQNGSFDLVTCVLALQNIKDIESVFSECARVLKKGGRLVFVVNHPAFRIPKRSSWGFDEERYLQYRRLDGYLSNTSSKIDMTPGTKGEKYKEYTWSFHRPLESYVQALSQSGFVIQGLEEWVSHRESEPGPRAKAENRARSEFPLFLAVDAVKL